MFRIGARVTQGSRRDFDADDAFGPGGKRNGEKANPTMKIERPADRLDRQYRFEKLSQQEAIRLKEAPR